MVATFEELRKKKVPSFEELRSPEAAESPWNPLYDPMEEYKGFEDIVKTSEELGISVAESNINHRQLADKPKKRPPSKAVMNIVAVTPSRWEKFKNFFIGHRDPLPPDADRIEKVSRAFDIGLTLPMRVFMKFSAGMTLGAPDLMWAAVKRVAPEEMWEDEVKHMTLDEAMDWAGGYEPSGFQKSIGEVAEFIGRLKTVTPIAEKLGVIGNTPKDINTLNKAFEMAKLFGAAGVSEQVGKYAATKIDPTEAEYGYEGPKAVLRDMAIGAVFSLLHSGAKGAWSKITPTEMDRARKLLNVSKDTSTDEIRRAAQKLAKKYHPDKAKGFRTEFEKVIKARDKLFEGEPEDIVYRGQKVVFKPKLLPGETAKQQAARLAKKPAQPPVKPPSKPVKPPKAPEAVMAQKGEGKQSKVMPEHEYAAPGIIKINSTIGEIRVPEVDLTGKYGDDLETVFSYGNFQGEVEQPGLKRSLSVGDVIRYRDHLFLIDHQGWKDITGRSPAELKAILGSENLLKVQLVSQIAKEKPDVKAVTAPKPQAKPETRDILGGVDPIVTIQQTLRKAKAKQPITEAQKKQVLKTRVGKAIASMKSNVKKGTPAEEAVFKSTGLLKGPLVEYDQIYESIEDVLEPGAKAAAYDKIYNHPGFQYFDIVNTNKAFKKLLAGAALTPKDAEYIEMVFGKSFKEFTEVRTTKSDLYDRIISIWKAGLLTGIKTSGLNTLANLSHSMTETAKDIPATLVDSVASLVTGERMLAFTTKGAKQGVMDGFVKGWRYLRTGVDERHTGEKLDYKKINFGTSKFAKGLQAYEETIFHLLGAEDQPFYYGAKARSLFSQAVAQAKNKGLKGKKRTDYVNNAVQNPTDKMLEYAVYDAEIAVFQNRTHLGDFAKAFQKIKGGEIIVPFGRTPSAVAMQIVNYTPLGAIKDIAEQIHSGTFNQRKFSHAMGRAAIGTGALYIGAQLFTAGLMTLDYPDNKRERDLWKTEGRNANSILVDGKWRSVHTLGPAGNVLLIGGYFQRALTETGSPTEAIVTAMTGGAKSFSEQTFVRGVNMAVDAMVSPERSFENWFSSMAGSAVPTIVADIARAQDDISRKAIGPKEKVQTRIPVWRKGLEPSINVFGQDLPRYGGNVLETMIDPTRPSVVRQDVVVEEMRRLFDKGVKVSPTQVGDKAGYDILTKEENTLLWRRSGELTYKSLLALINSPGYKNVNDFTKGRMVEATVNGAKAVAKAEIVKIKTAQGKTVLELAESGLLQIDALEALQYFKKYPEE